MPAAKESQGRWTVPRWKRRVNAGRFYRGGGGFKRKGDMSMLMEVIASSLSLGCLGCGGLSVWYAFGPAKEDEIQALYLFVGPLVMVPLAYLFGIQASAEAWVYSGAIAVAGGFHWMLRSIVRRE